MPHRKVWLRIAIIPASLCIFGCGPSSPPALDATEVFRKVSPSVAKVYGLSGTPDNNRSGTGFAVTLGELVLVTNRHVVEKASVVVVETETGVWTIDQWREHPHLDIALLSLPDSAKIPPAPLSSASELDPGRKVFTVGYPLGDYLTVQEGIVSSVEGVDLVYSAPLSSGASGSPLLDSEARVVGLCHSYVANAQNYNLAIPSDFMVLRTEWKEKRSSPDPGLAEYVRKIRAAKTRSAKTLRDWNLVSQEFPEWKPWIRRTNLTRQPLMRSIEDLSLAVHSVEWENLGDQKYKPADLLSASLIKKRASDVDRAWQMHKENIDMCATLPRPPSLLQNQREGDLILSLLNSARWLASAAEDILGANSSPAGDLGQPLSAPASGGILEVSLALQNHSELEARLSLDNLP
jgi:hypothetical protein